MAGITGITPEFKNSDLIRKGAFVDGQWLETASETFNVTDPATLEVIATLPDQSIEVIHEAIDSAAEAFRLFKKTTPKTRSTWLRNLYNLMMENVDDLAKIITWENGKALSEAQGEVKYAASYFEWYAEEAVRMYGTTIQPNNGSDGHR